TARFLLGRDGRGTYFPPPVHVLLEFKQRERRKSPPRVKKGKGHGLPSTLALEVCRRQDLNLHDLCGHQALKGACLPFPRLQPASNGFALKDLRSPAGCTRIVRTWRPHSQG